MRYYIHVSNHGFEPNQVLGVWEINDTMAKRIDVTDSDHNRYPAMPGGTPLETLRFSNPGTTFDELELEPGEYYAGMARPILGESQGHNRDHSVEALGHRASASGQLHALIQ